MTAATIARFVDRLSAGTAVPAALRQAYSRWRHLRYGSLIARNVALKDRFRGRRCVIVGTGVSVDEIDFGQLSNEYVFACNLLAKHKSFHRLKVAFYSATTPPEALYSPYYERILLYAVYAPADGVPIRHDNADAVIADLFSQTAEFYSGADEQTRRPHHFFSLLDQTCPDRSTVWFLDASGHQFFRRAQLFRGRQVFYVLKGFDPATALFDLAKPISFANGGLASSITVAIYMGFTEILLCGCGYTYQPRQEFHFYDAPVISLEFSEREALDWSARFAASRGVTLHRMDRVSAGYRPMFVRHQPPADSDRAIEAYARSRGVRILNLVPEGFESPVFEAVRPADVWERRRGEPVILGRPV